MEKKGKEIIGNAYRELKKLVKEYASRDYSVLFYGETGSGKEMFTQLYFELNNRKDTKKIINCAAIPQDLIASEIFGHVKGAFTGADRDRLGKLRDCDKGILCLDELGSTSPEFQAAILRVKEGQSFNPVGSEEEIPVDTKIIATTNDLGKIRDDLKHRFHLLPIPPLQKFDIPLLAKHFLGKSLRKEVLEEMMARDYPGNVRDLERYCQQLRAERGATIFAGKDSIAPGTGSLNYNRFKEEIETWDRYIQPILDKYKLNFRYKYLRPFTSGGKSFPLPRRSIFELVWGDLKGVQIKVKDTQGIVLT